MKLFRFCSFDELNRALGGNTLVNRTDHRRERHRRTKSVGFCWFDEDTLSVYEAALVLVGIATTEFLLEVEVDDPEKAGFVRSEGVYYDHRWERGKTDEEIEEIVKQELVDMAMGRKVDRAITLREWCLQSYCLDDFPAFEVRCIDVPGLAMRGLPIFKCLTSEPWREGGFKLFYRNKDAPKGRVASFHAPMTSEDVGKIMLVAHLTFELYHNLSEEIKDDNIADLERAVKEQVDAEVKDAVARAYSERSKVKKKGGKNGKKKK